MAGDARNKRCLPPNVDNLEGGWSAGLVSRFPIPMPQTPFAGESRFPGFESARPNSESRQDKLR